MVSDAPSRRQFLGGSLFGSLALLSGCEKSDATGTTPPDCAGPPAARQTGIAAQEANEIDLTSIAQAERVTGVNYTDSERQTIVETLEGQLAELEARRSFRPPLELSPATVYDPRAPGIRYPGPGASKARASTRASVPFSPAPEDIAFASLGQLGAWLRRGKLTSVALTELYLERLTTHGPKLECVVTLMEDQALRAATLADEQLAAGEDLGPLHGIPWGAKDLLDTAGVPTTFGAATHRERMPDGDAAVVANLREAGAVLVAKLSLGALAYGDIWYAGRTNNPWNLDEGSSGSSAGSASATAAGLVGFAIGTETLGSIISPSMRCGTVGLRPTFGRVSRRGAMPLCWSLDKIGPLTRYVEDSALVLAAINGLDDVDPPDPANLDVRFKYDGRTHDPKDLSELRVGYDPRWFEGEDNPERALEREVLEHLKALGATLVEFELEALPYAGLAPILTSEAAAAFEELTLDNRDDLLSWQEPYAWPNLFRLARFIPAVDFIQAQRLRRQARDSLEQRLGAGEFDALISPSFAGELLLLTNFTGHPSLTLRVGFTQQPGRDPVRDEDPQSEAEPELRRVPHGITLWGRLFGEDRLIRIGHALEQRLGVAGERPAL